MPSDEYREVNGKPELVTDDEYKKAIRGFLVKVVGGAVQPVTGDPKSRALECGIEDAQQLEQCKRLVDALLDEKLDRLEVVHRPARRDVGKKSTDCEYLKVGMSTGQHCSITSSFALTGCSLSEIIT